MILLMIFDNDAWRTHWTVNHRKIRICQTELERMTSGSVASALPYRAPQVDAFNVTVLLRTKTRVFFKVQTLVIDLIYLVV